MRWGLEDFDLKQISKDSSLLSFDCELGDITNFLQSDALNYQEQQLGNTYTFTDQKDNIWAYFTICNDCLKDTGDSSVFQNSTWNRLHRSMSLPNPKRIKQYPSVKVGKLGVHTGLQGTGLAYQIMDFIKEWVLIDLKPACRLLLLDAVNQAKQIRFYQRNDFNFLAPSDLHQKTRMMYYDLLNHDVA